MSVSNYLDNFAFAVSGRIAANGPLIVLKVTNDKGAADAFHLQHCKRFPFSSGFITKPADKAQVVGKWFPRKNGEPHKGGRALTGSK